MWKYVLIVVVLVAVYLFVPRYDLMQRQSENINEYVLAEAGFWRLQSCRDAGAQLKKEFRCSKYSLWVRIMGRQHQITTPRIVE
jgi:hypothetical protein